VDELLLVVVNFPLLHLQLCGHHVIGPLDTSIMIKPRTNQDYIYIRLFWDYDIGVWSTRLRSGHLRCDLSPNLIFFNVMQYGKFFCIREWLISYSICFAVSNKNQQNANFDVKMARYLVMFVCLYIYIHSITYTYTYT
jgi:hypothetical protein